MKHKACAKCAGTVGRVNVVGNILMIAIKGYLGVVGGSKGLIADAIHSCADLLATIVMIIGLRISGQEKDEQYPYGYGKAEYIVSIIIYLFLFVIACYILWDGTITILSGRHVKPRMVALWGALFSILINELMFRQTLCAGTQVNSPSMIAKAWESRTDVYSSIAVLIGVAGAELGFHFMDPLAAVIVGVLILKICVEMSKEAILNLLDKAPEDMDLEEMRDKLTKKLADPTVAIRNIQAREMGGSLEFHVEVGVPDSITVNQGEDLKNKIRKIFSSMHERESRVQVLLCPIEQEAE